MRASVARPSWTSKLPERFLRLGFAVLLTPELGRVIVTHDRLCRGILILLCFL
jgi:hypothetical protein